MIKDVCFVDCDLDRAARGDCIPPFEAADSLAQFLKATDQVQLLRIRYAGANNLLILMANG